jgi:NADH-quinone oxidoreductase subunit C
MRTNSNALNVPFLATQANVLTRLNEKYSTERKVEVDSVNEAIIWAKNPDDAKILIRSFIQDPALKIDFLSDLTAYDNKDHVDGDKRFVVVYQLYSLELHIRVRVKCLVNETEQANTITDIYPAANWLEREVYDMYGITFKGHPNLRRIMMDERFSGFPLRKEFPIKQREPFKDNIAFHLGANPLEVDTHIHPTEESK